MHPRILVVLCVLAAVGAAQAPGWSADTLATRLADAWRWRDLPLPGDALAVGVTALDDGRLVVSTARAELLFDGTTWTRHEGRGLAVPGRVAEHAEVRLEATTQRTLRIDDRAGTTRTASLPDGARVLDVAWLGDDRLAFVLLTGRVALCDVGSRRWTRLDLAETFGTGVVDALAASRDGGLWVGTPHGVGLLRDGRVVRVLEPPDEFVREGRTVDVVTALHEDARGHLWVGSGSAFGGVIEYAPDGARWHRHPDGTRDFCVHAIDATSDGALWFSLLGRGPGFAGAAGGLARLHDGVWTRWTRDDGLPDERTYSVAEAPDGTILVGTLEAPARLAGERWQRLPGPLAESLQVRDIAFDGDVAWMAYRGQGAGVLRARWRDGRPVDLERWKGPLSETVTPDGRGGAWVATQLGLHHVTDGGLAAVSTASPTPDAMWPVQRDGDGLWIGTRDGLLRFTPDDVTPPSILSVTTTRSDARDRLFVDVDARDAWLQTPTAQLLASFRVADGPWSRPRPIDAALEVVGLSPGMQRVSVRVVDAYGNVSTPSVVWVDVDAPWYLAWPTWLGATLTLGGLAAWWDERRRRRRDRELARRRLLEAQERERGLIAHEIHDGLGRLVRGAEADLDRVDAAHDAAARDQLLHHALTACRTAAERVHDLSTRLRPRVLDDLGLREALATELDVFATRLGAQLGEDLDERLDALPSTIAGQVFRIVLEALAEIERNARGLTRLDVSARVDDGRLLVELADDGRRVVTRLRGVSELVSRERAESIGGALRVETNAERGRRVAVDVPLRTAELEATS